MAKKQKPVDQYDDVSDINEEVSTEAVASSTTGKKSKMVDKNTILELDMNLEDYEDFEPLPKGEYPGTVTTAEARVSDKGNEYYYLVFQIHPDDYPVDYAVENAPEGLNLTFARVQKPTAANRRSITGVKNLLRALGESLKTNTINPGAWEGKKAKLVVGLQEWQGELRNQIDRVEALD